VTIWPVPTRPPSRRCVATQHTSLLVQLALPEQVRATVSRPASVAHSATEAAHEDPRASTQQTGVAPSQVAFPHVIPAPGAEASVGPPPVPEVAPVPLVAMPLVPPPMVPLMVAVPLPPALVPLMATVPLPPALVPLMATVPLPPVPLMATEPLPPALVPLMVAVPLPPALVPVLPTSVDEEPPQPTAMTIETHANLKKDDMTRPPSNVFGVNNSAPSPAAEGRSPGPGGDSAISREAR